MKDAFDYTIMQLAPAPSGLLAHYVDGDHKIKGSLRVHYVAVCEARLKNADGTIRDGAEPTRVVKGVTLIGCGGACDFMVCDDVDCLKQVHDWSGLTFAGLYFEDATPGNGHKIIEGISWDDLK